MTGILNGLFAARSGVDSHGLAIAVISDNISNLSTIGYKSARVEFGDLIAGGQVSGRVLGSGSTVTAVTAPQAQGTLENTGRSLDLAVDGNGYFIVADGAERFYSRAGNFKIDTAGFIVTQANLAVLGFPAGGTGTPEPININSISQDSVASTDVTIAGNLDASTSALTNGAADIPTVPATNATGSTVSYADLNAVAAFSTFVEVFDSQGGAHTLTVFFYKTAENEYTARVYVNSEDVDSSGSITGFPRIASSDGAATGVEDFVLEFASDGTLDTGAGSSTVEEITLQIPWNNGSATSSITLDFGSFTQFSTNSNILSITQDGEGVGNITSISIEQNGDVFAVLDNGQTPIIGKIALANFANSEGLTRLGGQLLQQSTESGEPLVGRPGSGTFGIIQAGTVELSTVDIAEEFVKLITTQRGFQANSRLINTIDQLLNELIQLA